MRIVRHKFNAKITEYGGHKYASKKEALYAQGLDFRIKAGDVIFCLRQIPIRLPGNVKYVVDFVEFHADGTVHFVDVKGKRTSEYITKKKIVEAQYPIIIEEM